MYKGEEEENVCSKQLKDMVVSTKGECLLKMIKEQDDTFQRRLKRKNTDMQKQDTQQTLPI